MLSRLILWISSRVRYHTKNSIPIEYYTGSECVASRRQHISWEKSIHLVPYIVLTCQPISVDEVHGGTKDVVTVFRAESHLETGGRKGFRTGGRPIQDTSVVEPRCLRGAGATRKSVCGQAKQLSRPGALRRAPNGTRQFPRSRIIGLQSRLRAQHLISYAKTVKRHNARALRRPYANTTSFLWGRAAGDQ